MYDLIGDIHGHADELKQLLAKLDYRLVNNSYKHEDRKVIFIGDYIDRGPKIRETLSIVKSMVDAGNAIALMGNHEYNAICYHTNVNGKPLRQHSIKNIEQHEKTIKEFQGNKKELESYIEWFKTLPLYFENNKLRAVHACWDVDSIEYLNKYLNGNHLNDSALHDAHNGNKKLYDALEITLKGKEIQLPSGLTFLDKDKHVRSEIRVKWWLKADQIRYSAYSITEVHGLADTAVFSSPEPHYDENQLPVFFGHYWLEGTPTIPRANICCLDYSVAKEGSLVGYRFGSDALDNQNFHSVKAEQKNSA